MGGCVSAYGGGDISLIMTLYERRDKVQMGSSSGPSVSLIRRDGVGGLRRQIGAGVRPDLDSRWELIHNRVNTRPERHDPSSCSCLCSDNTSPNEPLE